jgi:rhamnosyltransferase subunit B
MNVLLVPVGSHGDVHPLVGLGRGLAARGHRVTLVTAAPFAGLAERNGFDFTPVGTEADYREAIENPDLWHPRRSLGVLFEPTRFARTLREAYHLLADKYVHGETVIVTTSLGLAARLVNEVLGVPLATAHLQPSVLWSAADPPVGVPRWLPPAARRLLYRAVDRLLMDRVVGRSVNRFRAELGLPPVRRLWATWKDSPQRQLALFPRWYADAPDWPAALRQTGFVRYDGDALDLPPAVEEFLAAGEPPVVVSFGSAMRTGRPHFAAAVEAVHRLGRRGLVLARSGDQIPPLPPGVLHADYAPFSRVLPRAAAVVHHGGIGTAAQALAAGVPQLVMPLAFDQPDNAARLVRLGVARAVPAKRFTPAAATAALKELLDAPAVAAACGDAKAKAAGDPTDETCRLVEELRGTDRPGGWR